MCHEINPQQSVRPASQSVSQSGRCYTSAQKRDVSSDPKTVAVSQSVSQAGQSVSQSIRPPLHVRTEEGRKLSSKDGCSQSVSQLRQPINPSVSQAAVACLH